MGAREGVFPLSAAVRSPPGKAKGIDATLRVRAATPVRPWPGPIHPDLFWRNESASGVE